MAVSGATLATVAAATLVSAAVSATGSILAAQASAQGAENAQATIQGGIARLTGFRQQLKEYNQSYADWQKTTTEGMVKDVNAPVLESQSYKDAQRRFIAAQAATGSVRSGGTGAGLAELAGSESDAQFARKLAVDQLLQHQTLSSDALRASTYRDEAALLGGKANAQMQEANAKAAGIETTAGTVSSGISSLAGAAMGAGGGGGGGAGAMALGKSFGEADMLFGGGNYPQIDTSASSLLGGSPRPGLGVGGYGYNSRLFGG